jgi:hypothetical protein
MGSAPRVKLVNLGRFGPPVGVRPIQAQHEVNVPAIVNVRSRSTSAVLRNKIARRRLLNEMQRRE